MKRKNSLRKKILKILGIGIAVAVLGCLFTSIMTYFFAGNNILIWAPISFSYEITFMIYLLFYTIVVNVVCTILILIKK